MPAMNILVETFSKDGVTKYGDEVGTVKVDIGYGKVVTAKAIKRSSKFSGDTVQVAGFVGRYVTSSKPWPASVDGAGTKVWVDFGRDDRSGRFNKSAMIRFEPDVYGDLTNNAYWTAI